MSTYIIWTSLLIFVVSYLVLNYKTMCSGTLTRQTKWPDMKRGDWLMVAGTLQLGITFALVGIIAFTRTY